MNNRLIFSYFHLIKRVILNFYQRINLLMLYFLHFGQNNIQLLHNNRLCWRNIIWRDLFTYLYLLRLWFDVFLRWTFWFIFLKRLIFGWIFSSRVILLLWERLLFLCSVLSLYLGLDFLFSSVVRHLLVLINPFFLVPSSFSPFPLTLSLNLPVAFPVAYACTLSTLLLWLFLLTLISKP